MSEPCASCGGPKPEYSPSFVQLWEQAMAFFPLYSLPEIKSCVDCMMVMHGRRPLTQGYRKRRRTWLRSGTEWTRLDLNDPEVQKSIRRGKRKAKAYEKLIAKQKRKLKKIKDRREKRKWDRWFKQREKKFREVIERAIEEDIGTK